MGFWQGLKDVAKKIDLRRQAKAIAGAIVTGAAGTGTAATIIIPEGVLVPWYGYLIIAGANAAIGYLGVYYAPRNVYRDEGKVSRSG